MQKAKIAGKSKRLLQFVGGFVISKFMKSTGHAIILAAFCLTGCGTRSTEFSPYRYRFKVEIETPEGVRSGSSVIEVRTVMLGKVSLKPGGIYYKSKGQAVEIDLGHRGKVFAILNSGRNENWPSYIIRSLSPWVRGSDREESVRKTIAGIKRQRDPIVLRGELIERLGPARPLIVRFKNINDPTSVQILDPDNLASSLGAGVNLLQMTVEITDAPVTTGIEKTLPWLAWQKGSLVPIKPGVNNPNEIRKESRITEISFSRGFGK